MKKFLCCFCLFCFTILLLTACNEKEAAEVNFEKLEIVLEEGEEYELSPTGTYTTIKYATSDAQIITITDNVIKALKEGEAKINVYLDDSEEISKTLTVTVNKKEPVKIPTLSFAKKEYSMTVDEKITLEPIIKDLLNETDKVTYSISDETILKIEGNEVTALKKGTATVTASLSGAEESQTLTFDIAEKIIPVETITISGKDILEIGDEETYTVSIAPDNATDKEYAFETSDEEIATITSDGVLTAIKSGEVVVRAYLKNTLKYSEIVLTILAKDVTAPVITATDTTINYNETIDLKSLASAIDDRDGDVSSEIEVESDFNNKVVGTYKVTYSVKDKALNEATKEINVTVVWNSKVNFIGHGGSYLGIMNTEEAFLNAILVKGYLYLECDLKQTKDGVFVLCHDDTFNGKALTSYTYEELKDEEYTTTRGGITYTTKLCTLERYLEICKTYNVKPLIELKYSKGINNSDTSRMSAMMNVIRQAGMLNDVMFLASQYKTLQWIRDNGYKNIPCQYLVTSIESESSLKMCVDYNFDISFNVEGKNSEEWIRRYQAYGLKVSSYTFSQYATAELLQTWINKGVDFVTCDVLTGADVTLPPLVDDSVKYTVTYKDDDGSTILVCKVKEGTNAPLPLTPEKEGYSFIGWSGSTENVTADITVNATYKSEMYTITYLENPYSIEAEAWATKEEFVNELYTDWFNWYKDNAANISGLTVNNGVYSLTKSGMTATWSSVAELKAIDLYTFEKTIGALAYKPVTRVNDAPVEPESDNNYFLNTEPYRTKYRALDGYLLNAMKVSYPGYSYAFKPTSAGKVQIFFRFHQWCTTTTKIAALDAYPAKYVQKTLDLGTVTMPTTHLTFLAGESFTLPVPTATKGTFLGWFLDPEFTTQITEVTATTASDLTLYAKWEVTE